MSWYYPETRPRRVPLTTPVRPAATGGGGGPPTGPAGGDLAGSYPNPTLAPGAVGTTDLVDGAVTDAKVTSVAYTKVTGAPSIPTTLPPSGPAGGDLTGTYPNPTIKPGLPPITISVTAPVAPVSGCLWWRPTDGNLYIYYDDGSSTQWVPAVATVGKLAGAAAVYTFWPDTFTPTPGTGTTVPANCGMAFVSTVAGTVTAIQFWKVATDTGSHVGTMYRESDQVVLGSVTFSGESGSGWQTATLGTPVAIAAGTRYRVAVSHSVGWADSLLGGFGGLTVGPLTMDRNSVYALSVSGYPTLINNNHSFYVDIISNF